MTKEKVITNPKTLVEIELKNAGFNIDSIKVPKRVFLLADDIYYKMLEKEYGIYKYPLGGKLYVFKNNHQIGFIKSQMCSPGIATQAEDLIAGGVRELIHIGFAGGITSDVKIGNVIITDGTYNDTAVAGLYGYNSDFLDTTKSLTNEIEQLFIENHMQIHRGKHWTTDAGYHETWEQIINYRSKQALCVEMEGVGLFTIAKYRNCSATAVYIITDVITENGWSLGWNGKKIDKVVSKIVDIIYNSTNQFILRKEV